MTAATLGLVTSLFLVSTYFDIKRQRVPNVFTASLYILGTYQLLEATQVLQKASVFIILLSIGYLIQVKGHWAAADKHYLALPIIFLPAGSTLPYIIIYAATDTAWNWIHKKKDNQQAPYLPVPVAAYVMTLAATVVV